MDFILLDIKNFLKKLENGQLEIEAGQWELHKDLTSMKFAIEELKSLKEDVEKMKLNSIQQMNLIKAVQKNIKMFEQEQLEDRPMTVSERSLKYEKVYKRPPDKKPSLQGRKKRKNHFIRSEEFLEITSQLSNENTEPKQEKLKSKPKKRKTNVKFERNLENNSTRSIQRELSLIIPSPEESNSDFTYLTNNDILQRYLEDSAKYMNKMKFKSSELAFDGLQQNSENNNLVTADSEFTPFWDEYGFGDAENSIYENRNFSKKDNSDSETKKKIDILSKSSFCPSRPKKFLNNSDFSKLERNRKRVKIVFYCESCGKGFCNKRRLKQHEAIHRKSSVDSTGFKCSYCNQICGTPEELTSHLRECRTIMRHHFRRK